MTLAPQVAREITRAVLKQVERLVIVVVAVKEGLDLAAGATVVEAEGAVMARKDNASVVVQSGKINDKCLPTNAENDWIAARRTVCLKDKNEATSEVCHA
jgi:hypothetical protein